MSRRIGLLTLPLHTNYGGIVQAVALHEVLANELGHDVVFMDRWWRVLPTTRLHRTFVAALERLPFLPALRGRLAAAAEGRTPVLLTRGQCRKLLQKADLALRSQKINRHRAFLRQHLPQRTRKLTSTEAFAQDVQQRGIDTLVVGSDQVWRLDYLPPGSEEDFFFGFAASPAVRKIAYAASFGHGSWTFPDRTGRIAELVTRFDAVSVREASGVDICAQSFGRHDAVHVIDPTLLVDPGFYDTIAAPPPRQRQPHLLSYVLDEAPERQDLGRRILAALGPGHAHRSLKLDADARAIDVPQWLRAFMDADFVVTDSFHGMAFSIIFRKNFVAVVNRGRGADRFHSLARLLGVEHRLVADPAEAPLDTLVREPIDYRQVAARLAPLRAASRNFLSQALDAAAQAGTRP